MSDFKYYKPNWFFMAKKMDTDFVAGNHDGKAGDYWIKSSDGDEWAMDGEAFEASYGPVATFDEFCEALSVFGKPLPETEQIEADFTTPEVEEVYEPEDWGATNPL